MSGAANRIRMVGSYFLPKAAARLGVRPYPQEVVLELTNHCNLACVMCPHKDMTRAKGLMDEALFRRIIDEISGRSELVYLYGTGESLIHPGLCDYIRYARSKGLTTCLSTNGQLMDEAASRALLASGLDFLIVALDGGVRETYESIRVKGSFPRLVDNIRDLLRLKRETRSPVHLTLQMIYMPRNRHEIGSFTGLFSESERVQVDSFRFKPLYETYALQKLPVRHTRPCFWLWNMLSVHWNGHVSLCCMDGDAAYDLGDLNTQSVAEVWNGPGLAAIRASHSRVEYDGMPLCATCDMPELGYFSPLTILGSLFLDAGQVRRLIPLYEKYVLLPAGRTTLPPDGAQ